MIKVIPFCVAMGMVSHFQGLCSANRGLGGGQTLFKLFHSFFRRSFAWGVGSKNCDSDYDAVRQSWYLSMHLRSSYLKRRSG